jgi:DNA-directed RNA polymerase specialized sigma24 family protein
MPTKNFAISRPSVEAIDMAGFRAGGQAAFKLIYDILVNCLELYALGFTATAAQGEDLVAQVFYETFDSRQQLLSYQSIKQFCLSRLEELLKEVAVSKNTNVRLNPHLSKTSAAIVLRRISQWRQDIAVYQTLFERLVDLPPITAAVIWSATFRGMQDDEIAHEYPISLSEVKVHKSRAIAILVDSILTEKWLTHPPFSNRHRITASM